MSVSMPQMPRMAFKRNTSTVKANRLIRAKKITDIVPLGTYTHMGRGVLTISRR